MAVFWDCASCNLVKFMDVLEVLSAPIISMMISLMVEAGLDCFGKPCSACSRTINIENRLPIRTKF
jgi:hypothetical protein